MILKGDRVQMVDGSTGEIVELWGVARLFARIKRDSDGKTTPVMASHIVSFQRPEPKLKLRGGERSEKRKTSNDEAEAGYFLC